MIDTCPHAVYNYIYIILYIYTDRQTETEGDWDSSLLDLRAAELAAGRKKCSLAAGKIAASRQPGRKKYVAKPPPKVQKAALPRDVNEKLAITIQSSYEHAVKLRCCTKIGKNEKILLFRTLWALISMLSSMLCTLKSDAAADLVLQIAVECIVIQN